MLHKFVEQFPETLEEGIIYVSLKYGTVAHLCCCGCGSEIVTPLSPTDWKLIYDGESVSLYPSIGNWGLPCRSHYWIQNGTVRWAGDRSDAEIEATREYDRSARLEYYTKRARTTISNIDVADTDENQSTVRSKGSFWRFLARFRHIRC